MTLRIFFSKSTPEPADDRRSARGRAGGMAMPAAARLAAIVAVLVAMAGALYLILVRGDALLIDLAKLGRVICF
jgi:hypothetical protein